MESKLRSGHRLCSLLSGWHCFQTLSANKAKKIYVYIPTHIYTHTHYLHILSLLLSLSLYISIYIYVKRNTESCWTLRLQPSTTWYILAFQEGILMRSSVFSCFHYRLLISCKGENRYTGDMGLHTYWLIKISISIEGKIDSMSLWA